MGSDPSPARYVSDGDAIANQVAVGGLGEMVVHGAIQTARLVCVAVNAVLDLLGGVS